MATLSSSLNHAWMSTRSHFHTTTLLLVITRILNLICRFQTSRLNPHYGIQPTPVTVPILLQGIWCDIKREDDEELCVSLSLFANLTSRAVRHKINIARQVFRQPPRTTQGELERKESRGTSICTSCSAQHKIGCYLRRAAATFKTAQARLGAFNVFYMLNLRRMWSGGD